MPGALQEKEIGSSRLPFFIVKDQASKAVWSHPVPAKGVEDPCATACFTDALNKTGYTRVV